jgi:site-specific DNA recombinase
LTATLAGEQRSTRLVHEHLTKRLTELDTKEDNLLDLVQSGNAVAAKVRDRLMAIVEERARVKTELAAQGPLLEAGAAVIEAALDLLDDPQELCRQTSDPVRRQLTEVFFDRLYLDMPEGVTEDRLAAPFNDFPTQPAPSASYPHSRPQGRSEKRRHMGRRWRDKCRCRPTRPHCAWRGFE